MVNELIKKKYDASVNFRVKKSCKKHPGRSILILLVRAVPVILVQ